MSDLLVTRFAPVRERVSRAEPQRLLKALRIVWRTYRTRQALPELTDRELADIGVASVAALAEAARLPWDAAPRPGQPAPTGVAGFVHRALERARTRRLLARMQAREFRDIGISRFDAQIEASKPFWRK
jgi:uncharacterized protein YjiS (DUF1127 family)